MAREREHHHCDRLDCERCYDPDRGPTRPWYPILSQVSTAVSSWYAVVLRSQCERCLFGRDDEAILIVLSGTEGNPRPVPPGSELEGTFRFDDRHLTPEMHLRGLTGRSQTHWTFGRRPPEVTPGDIDESRLRKVDLRRT